MNQLQIFKNSEFGEVRTVTINNEPWMVAKDVCDALGYSNSRDAVLRHVDEDDRAGVVVHDGSQNRNVQAINESGMYALVFGSKLESAKRFKKWVTSEVLPAIRKTGTYQFKTDPFALMQQQLDMMKEQDTRISKLENNMTIDYAQQLTLERLVKKQVIDALGGMETPAYKNVAKKVFAECNRDVKNYFNVNSRNNIAVLDFDKARQFISNWKPCYTTELMIKEENEQMCFS